MIRLDLEGTRNEKRSGLVNEVEKEDDGEPRWVLPKMLGCLAVFIVVFDIRLNRSRLPLPEPPKSIRVRTSQARR